MEKNLYCLVSSHKDELFEKRTCCRIWVVEGHKTRIKDQMGFMNISSKIQSGISCDKEVSNN